MTTLFLTGFMVLTSLLAYKQRAKLIKLRSKK